jgi:hypothetical protein
MSVEQFNVHKPPPCISAINVVIKNGCSDRFSCGTCPTYFENTLADSNRAP